MTEVKKLVVITQYEYESLLAKANMSEEDLKDLSEKPSDKNEKNLEFRNIVDLNDRAQKSYKKKKRYPKEEENLPDGIVIKKHIHPNDTKPERLKVLLQKLERYVPKANYNRASVLVKRIFSNENAVIEDGNMILGGNAFGYQLFLDFVEFVFGRRKPVENENFKKFVRYLALNDIPLTHINNRYVRKEMIEILNRFQEANVEKNGDTVAKPDPIATSTTLISNTRLRRLPLNWYASMKDVPSRSMK